MQSGLRIAALILAAALAACSGTVPDTPHEPPAAHVAPATSRDARLRDDCGGWEPAPALLDEAANLGDASTKAAALATLDAATPAHRIDVLRAGLRLRDDAAARACAA